MRLWLHYCIRNDTAHCICCICSSNNTGPSESPFMSKGFKNWKKASDEHLDAHARSEVHQLSEEKMTNFLKTRCPGSDISARLHRQAAELQRWTMKGVLSIIDVVIALGQRSIPLRDNWDPSKRNEDRNFSFFVDLKSKYDPELKDHLDHASGSAEYTSPRIQNEIINLCDSFTRNRVRASIPKYWSVMARETQDCSTLNNLVYVCDISAVKMKSVKRGALGPIGNCKTVGKIVQNRKTENKFSIKTEKCMQNCQNRYIFTS